MSDWAIPLWLYPWIKALHIISVIAWMAGLLYLPRLFVYHADAPEGSEVAGTLEVMERRLLRGIVNPAMVAAYAFGGALLFVPGVVDWSSGWIYLKLLLVAGLTAAHYLYAGWHKDFAAGRNTQTAGFYRIANEVPTVIMVAVVILVVVRPF